MSTSKIVCIGEILWDSLPNGMFLGGAPLNVAVNLRRLGLDAQIVSAVGKDELGEQTIAILGEYGFDLEYIQRNPFPTGLVEVALNEQGVPTYVFHENVAWDNLQVTPSAEALISEAEVVVVGSLAFRNEISAASIFKLLESVKGTLVVDVNFRKPYYSQNLIGSLLSRADVLKVNDDEILEIAKWYGLSANYLESIPALCDKFSIREAFITLGEQGAAYYKHEAFSHQPRFKVKVADTVGAGDAFLAGAIWAGMQHKTPEEILAFANGMGAYVAGKKGATPPLDRKEIESFLA